VEPTDATPPGFGDPDPEQTYYRDGGDLTLFNYDQPSDPGLEMWFVDSRRLSLARSMRALADADGEPLFRVRRVPIGVGTPLHVHPGDRDHRDDSFGRGIERLGPLTFSLLRGQLLIGEHEGRRLSDLMRQYDDLIFGVLGARQAGAEDSDWLFREQAHLVMWDGIGLLHQISERLAILFHAVQSRSPEMGERMVTSRVQPWRVLQSPPFASPRVWRRILGIPGKKASLARLTDEQKDQVRSIHEQTEGLVREDVRLVRQVWTERLHRAATRLKHSTPALNISFGLVWLGDDPKTQADIRGLAERGGLVLADAGKSGALEQLIVPATIGSIEVLFSAIGAAHRTVHMLVHSVLEAAESANGSMLTIHPGVPLPQLMPQEEFEHLLTDYTNSPDVHPAVAPAIHKASSRAAIERAGWKLRREIEGRADALRSSDDPSSI